MMSLHPLGSRKRAISKSHFLLYVVNVFDIDSKLLQWTPIRKVGMNFPTTHNQPQLDPFPSFGGRKRERMAHNYIFHLQSLQFCGKISRIKTGSGKVVVRAYV